MRLVFANYCRTTNIGDLMSSPLHYFKFPEKVEHISIRRLGQDHALNASAIIIGGGAVMGTVRRIPTVSPAVPIIGWGVGQTHHGGTRRYVSAYAHRYRLLGTRELPLAGDNEVWVPCASAMHEAFDKLKDSTPERKAGVYLNSDPNITSRYPLPMSKSLTRLKTQTNRTTMEDALGFLASCETIITNSYHGAYWGQLLGRKVVVAAPYSAKFFGFRYMPTIWNDGSWESAAEKAVVQPGLLDGARSANKRFHQRVLTLLESL
jgi:hypothetical protein